MEKEQSVKIRINDLPETVQPGSSLQFLIDHYDEQDPDLIVELNGRFIYPRDYATTIVQSGDEIEFMNPDFGGGESYLFFNVLFLNFFYAALGLTLLIGVRSPFTLRQNLCSLSYLPHNHCLDSIAIMSAARKPPSATSPLPREDTLAPTDRKLHPRFSLEDRMIPA